MERENLDILIHGLETCLDGVCDDRCPYSEIHGCRPALMREALEALKEQEPKTGKLILDDDDANAWECSECSGGLCRSWTARRMKTIGITARIAEQNLKN